MNDRAPDLHRILKELDEARRRRAEALPDEPAALRVMFEAYDRLRELGWRDITYCPKDGTVFDSISAGSTGSHPCHYEGKWPDGHFWVQDGGDLWPAHPILFRLRDRSRMAKDLADWNI